MFVNFNEDSMLIMPCIIKNNNYYSKYDVYKWDINRISYLNRRFVMEEKNLSFSIILSENFSFRS